MTQAPTDNLYLHKLVITDFMGVEHEALDLNGNHAVISGGNASGKTSRLTALYAALAGVSVRDIPEPIRRGADKAQVRADLGDYRIELTITASGPRLVVTAADGSKIRRARDLLDGLLGEYSLDPSQFLDRRPQDQVDDVLAICGVRPPVDDVEQILGERIEPNEGETADQYLMRLSADETGLLYVRRREAHRKLDQDKGALQDAREQLDTLGGPVAEGEAPPSTSELMERQEALTERQQERYQHQQAVERERTRLRNVEEQQAKTEAAINAARGRCDDLEAQIAELQRQLEREQGNVESLQADLQEIVSDSVPGAKAALQEAEQALEQIPDPADELATIREQYREAEQQRETLQERRQAQQYMERLTLECDEARRQHDALDAQLEKLRELRRGLLENLDLGVDGLSVQFGELHLHDVPFRQCSARERLQVAVAVATRQPGKIRLLRIDNAERFDKESWQYLLGEAGRRGWQVVSAAVSDEGGPPKVEIVERVAETAGGAA